MVMLCFLLDLRSLSPPLLRDLKQSLMQLGNYYAVLSSKSNYSGDATVSKSLPDLIGLFYVFRNRISGSDELKIAYSPHGSFNLREFHLALNTLPTDAFSPESNDYGALCCKDLKLADILDNIVIHSWGGYDKNFKRKIIVISSCLVETLNYVSKEALMDATDKCVSLEFVFFEQKSSHFGDVTENVNHFRKQIGDLENCELQTCIPDLHVLFDLAKRWFQEIKVDVEKQVQACFVFRINLMNTLNQITCCLCTYYNPITDGFISCETCRCHGIPLGHSNLNQNTTSFCCPVTRSGLGALDIFENSIKIGEQTILYMPSFKCSPKFQQVSSPIDFNVIQRTNLGSLNEGLIIGATYVVTPQTFHDTDDKDKSDLNNQLFQAVCSFLNSLDQGLVCSSNCNIETAMETSFKCYYILLPSDKGVMLLRRLLASEEFLPTPYVSKFINCDIVKEIENAVQESLLKIEANEYNPELCERGFHKRLNLLVKQSLHIGEILPKDTEAGSESNLTQKDPSSEVQLSPQAADEPITGEETPHLDLVVGKVKSPACLTEEWEQLVVDDFRGMPSTPCTSHSKLDQPVMSPSQNNRKLDERTSRILERLETPRQIKRKAVSPTISSSVAADVHPPAKKPLIPYGPTNAAAQGPVASQPIKPYFQRIKKDKIARG